MGVEVPLCPPRSQASKHFHPKPRKQRNLLSTCVFTVQTPLRLSSVFQLSERQSAQGRQRRQNKCWASHAVHMYLRHRLPGSLSLLRFRRRVGRPRIRCPRSGEAHSPSSQFYCSKSFHSRLKGPGGMVRKAVMGRGFLSFPVSTGWSSQERWRRAEGRAHGPSSTLSRPKRCADLRVGVKC